MEREPCELEWAELQQRKAHINAAGLPAQLFVDWMGSLMVLRAEPLEGFTHLIRDGYVEMQTEKVGQYHISLGYWSELTGEDVEEVRRMWDGWRGLLAGEVSYGAGGWGRCFMLTQGLLVECPVLARIHLSYSDFPLHISM